MLTSTPHRLPELLLITCLLGLAGCSDDDARQADGGSNTDLSQRSELGPGPDGGPLDRGAVADLFRSDAGRCGELSATDCFSNLDCPTDRRCQSVDSVGLVVCCLPGPRGTKTAGESCAGESECASAVCVAKGDHPSVCSKDCQSEADCPTGMKDCKTIAFSGSSQQWCFPE